MRALVLRQYGQLEIEEVPVPLPGPDELQIRVAACGICGSDVHGYDGTSGRRIPPIVMGHEAAGVVTAVGGGVKGFAEGDRVTFDSTVFCGSCAFCQRGEVNLCDARQVLGVSCNEYSRTGAFAELLTIPARIAYHLPDELSFAEAALLEAVSVALHAVAISGQVQRQTVLVMGAGMIGLLLLQAAKVAGAGRALVADIDASRLQLAKELGADEVYLSTADSLVEAVKASTEGTGADLVLEAVGREETIAMSIDAVRKDGIVTLIGNISPQVPIPLQKVVSRQIRLQGSCASAGEYPQAMALMTDGAIKVRPLITAVAPLEDGAQWFQRLHAREPHLMKVVLDPRSTAASAEAQQL